MDTKPEEGLKTPINQIQETGMDTVHTSQEPEMETQTSPASRLQTSEIENIWGDLNPAPGTDLETNLEDMNWDMDLEYVWEKELMNMDEKK